MENGEHGEPRGIVKTERRIWAVTSAQQRPLWRIFSTHSPSIRPGLSNVHSRRYTAGEYEEVNIRSWYYCNFPFLCGHPFGVVVYLSAVVVASVGEVRQRRVHAVNNIQFSNY